MPKSNILPVSAAKANITTISFPPGYGVPNNARFPAVLARRVLRGEQPDHEVKALFEANGWGGTWTWRVFDFHHFHPDAFEALAVARGRATLRLGGSQGEDVDVAAGDVAILPPGFGHRQMSASGDFRICGAYPPGQEDYTVIKAADGYGKDILDEIERVGLPRTDPIFGCNGPLLVALTSKLQGS